MAKTEINICIDDKLEISLEDKWLKDIIKLSLKTAGFSMPAEVGLFITDSATIQELNKMYRGIDEPTDVLSFHTEQYTDKKQTTPGFITTPDGVQHLGEVIISYPQAIAQAKQHGHDMKKELSLLIIHGVLHLLGYDHEHPKDRQEMRAKECEILEKLVYK